MQNPCTRDCLDRYPGCDCEKRKAYKWQQEQVKEARRRENAVAYYKRDKLRSIRKPRRRRRWDE